jgi:NAD(P)-dependent dehydrogenase (short-subunit alcohol dehydrogenase family)
MEMEHVSFLPPGRTAVVTGGTRGIGRAIAERLLDAGADVVVCARRPPEQPIRGRARDREALFVACDVREPEQIDRVIAACVERFDRLDLLVNNAGGSPPASAAEASPRFSTAIIHLNLIAPLHFAQRANAIMQEQADGGLILNIASVSGLRPSPGTAAYGAAKAGLINLTQSLAVEWAPRVRVNAIAAGPIATDEARAQYDLSRAAADVPAGRLGEPADVADACLLLASPLARFISGATLTVHGGGERRAFYDPAARLGAH